MEMHSQYIRVRSFIVKLTRRKTMNHRLGFGDLRKRTVVPMLLLRQQ